MRNPIRTKGGRPKGERLAIKEMAKIAGPTTIVRLLALRDQQENLPVALAACRELLDRGFGRCPQPITSEAGGNVVFQVIETGVPRPPRIVETDMPRLLGLPE